MASLADSALFLVDDHGTLTTWSPAVESLLDYREDDFIGQDLSLLFTEQDRAAGVPSAVLERARAQGRADQVRLLVAKDGRAFQALCSIACLQRGRGEGACFAVIAAAAPPSSPNEDLLREQARLLDLSTDGIIVRGDGDRIEYWSSGARDLYGWSAEEALGKILHDLLETRFPKPLGEIVSELEKHRRWTGELEHRKKDGEWITVLSRWVVDRSDDGTRRVLETNSDVTERRRIERSLAQLTEDLRRTNSELEQFASVASHDMSEPLRMIGAYLGLLEKRYGAVLDETAHEYIAFAVEGVMRMRDLIDRLLDYSHSERNQRPFEWVEGAEVLRRAERNLTVSLEESGAELDRGELPRVWGDEVQLVQLFQNLIGNALKYQPVGRKPRIEIQGRERESDWLLSISDNGIGIESQYAQSIFEPFRRLHTRAEYPGTGLGLAVCKKIVERHGGRIWVESEVDKGSTFLFTLAKPAALGG